MNQHFFYPLLGGALLVAFVIGCDSQRDPSQSSAERSQMPANKEPNDGDAKPIHWTLGPIGDGDERDHDIAFRSPPSPKATGSIQPQKAKSRLGITQGAADSLCVSEDGGRFVGGSFSGKRDFDTGAGTDIREAVGVEDGFVTHIDRNGEYRWTATFGAKEKIQVRGIALSCGVVYAACDESKGHVAVLAMDSATGALVPGFGVSGCQMFHCGQFDSAAAIRCQGDRIYVAVRCGNFPGGKWPSCSFVAVLAIHSGDGSAVNTFGTGGVQTIGNIVGAGDSSSRGLSAGDSVEPLGLAMSNATLYVVGRCQGSSAGIGGQGAIVAGTGGKAFVAAIHAASGAALDGFGRNGVLVIAENASEAADAVVFGDSLYVTGCWRESSVEKAFVLALDAGSGAFSPHFGTAGITVFGSWTWQASWSIRVIGQAIYVAGGYMNSSSEGVFVAAFDRTSGLPLASFGNSGAQLVEGLRFGQQGRIECFGDTLFLAARTGIMRNEKREAKVGSTLLNYGEMNGLLLHFSKDGTLLAK